MEDEQVNVSDDLIKIWLKRKIYYYFMPTLNKYWHLKRVPFKLTIQLVKLIVITFQLVYFGSALAHSIQYNSNSQSSFEHLYLKDWQSSYETIPYPPNSGPFSYYTNDELNNALSFTLSQFNKTNDISIGGYTLTKEKSQEVEICITYVDIRIDEQKLQYLKTVCNIFNLANYPEESIKVNNILNFLKSGGIIVDPANLEKIDIKFRLNSSVLIKTFNTVNLIKYTFHVTVVFDNSFTTSRVLGYIQSHFLNRESFKNDILLGSDPEAIRTSTSLAIDIVAIILSIISMYLCIRSLFRGFKLFIITREYFKKYQDEDIGNCSSDFISKWYYLIVFGDLFIIIGSIIKANVEAEIYYKFQFCSYFLGIGTMLVWISILKYIDISQKYSVLIISLSKALPSILRFIFCSMFIFVGFALSGWLILGPYHIKFQTFMNTLECLFSILNGDDMYVTFSIIDSQSASLGLVFFSRVYLYSFIVIFMYVVLNFFLAIIIEAYETIKSGSKFSFINPIILNMIESEPVLISVPNKMVKEGLIIRKILGHDFKYKDYLWKKPAFDNSTSESSVNLMNESA